MKRKNLQLLYLITLLLYFSLFLSTCKKEDPVPTVKDIDGNEYHIVQIGTQTWMVENLRTTKYRDGTTIPYVSDNAGWSSSSSGKQCYYANQKANWETYGCLYNWYAVSDSRGLAPAGWHVATNDDYQKLAEHFGGMNLAGGKLKDAGTTYWTSPNTGGNNESGFKALPGGYRDFSGNFRSKGDFGFYWTSDADANNAISIQFSYNNVQVISYTYNKFYGYSVRCVKD